MRNELMSKAPADAVLGRSMLTAAVLVVMMTVCAAAWAQDDGGQVPPIAELRQRVEQELADYYGPAWQETDPAKRRALAHQMLRDARRADSATERYVLLQKAREFAESSGDARLALIALRELERDWNLPEAQADRPALVRNALAAARQPATYASVVRSGLGAIDELISDGAYREANALAGALRSGAVRARDRDLIAQVTAKQEETRQLLGAYRRIEADMQTLQETPNDPAANVAVGRFYAYQLGQWERALPYLVKGDAETDALVAIARADREEPADAEAQKRLGDRYWSLAKARDGQEARALRARARHWYRQALDRLSGSERERVMMRATSADAIRWAGRVFEPGVQVTYQRGDFVKRTVANRLSFDWRSKPPSPRLALDDRFNVNIEGYLNAPEEGHYTFTLTAYAGPVDARVNDQLLFEGGYGRASRVSAWLYEGLNSVDISFYVRNRPSRREMHFEWSPPDEGGDSVIGTGEIYHLLGDAR